MTKNRNGFVPDTVCTRVFLEVVRRGLIARVRGTVATIVLTIALEPFCTSMGVLDGIEMLVLT